MIRRTWLTVLMAITLFGLVSAPSEASAAPAVSTPCDSRLDTPLPDDAVIGGFGFPTRFLADVDGDGFKDVVTGYWSGSPEHETAEHYLHVELASGWGTAFNLGSVAQFSVFPVATPSRVVVMSGQRIIVTGVQSTLVGSDYAVFALHDCALVPVPLAEGGYPEIWTGIGPSHSEWFTCRPDGVVMVEVFVGVNDDFELFPGIYESGKASSYRLDGDRFLPTADVDLGLPRRAGDVRSEFPDCSNFVGTFVDDDTSIFQPSIEWLAFEGLTQGCNPPRNDRYCPQDDVTRGEMAAFLVRALGYSDDGGGDLFVDDDGSVFEAAIDRLGTAGVTKGCNPPADDRFCPERRVTRAEMAAFLVRALGLTDDGGGDLFVDDDGSVFEGAIDRLGAAGVTRGCNPPMNDRFCPDDYVTRGQVAAFLERLG